MSIIRFCKSSKKKTTHFVKVVDDHDTVTKKTKQVNGPIINPWPQALKCNMPFVK